MTGYVGVTNHGKPVHGEPPRALMRPILREMQASRSDVPGQYGNRDERRADWREGWLAVAMNDKVEVDKEVSRSAIDAALAELERIAKAAKGHAVAVARPYPLTLKPVAAMDGLASMKRGSSSHRSPRWSPNRKRPTAP